MFFGPNDSGTGHTLKGCRTMPYRLRSHFQTGAQPGCLRKLKIKVFTKEYTQIMLMTNFVNVLCVLVSFISYFSFPTATRPGPGLGIGT